MLICTVPHTPKTHALLNYKLFQKLKEPTYLINVSRGSVQVEKDIIKALNEGITFWSLFRCFLKKNLYQKTVLCGIIQKSKLPRILLV